MIHPTYRFFALPFISFAILGIFYWILGRNLALGIYPEDANDIGQPLFGAAFMLFFIAILEFSSGVITYTLMKATFIKRVLGAIVIILLHSLALYLLVISAIDWFKPHHILISYAYGIYALLVGLSFVSDIKVLLLNPN